MLILVMHVNLSEVVDIHLWPVFTGSTFKLLMEEKSYSPEYTSVGY